jgi:hypothetical protein
MRRIWALGTIDNMPMDITWGLRGLQANKQDVLLACLLWIAGFYRDYMRVEALEHVVSRVGRFLGQMPHPDEPR